jgi:hypothetical protein
MVPYLVRTDLARANLFKAHPEGAALQGAQFKGTNLQKAHLEGAILQEAHPEGAEEEQRVPEGGVVVVPTRLVHMYGATDEEPICHLAIRCPGRTDWHPPVPDEWRQFVYEWRQFVS